MMAPPSDIILDLVVAIGSLPHSVHHCGDGVFVELAEMAGA
jgi:hypothetical protein